MRITVWNDYICPWAYAARPQTAWLRARVAEAGLPSETVTVRSFELHPDLPVDGRPIAPSRRYDAVLDHIATECERRDHPFTKPTHTPNAHLVLSVAEFVAHHHPARHDTFDNAVARAYWVDGEDIGDAAVVATIADSAGLPGSELVSENSLAEGSSLLAGARSDAMLAGATATPSWQIDDFVVTGLHDDAQFQRWVGRILDRAG